MMGMESDDSDEDDDQEDKDKEPNEEEKELEDPKRCNVEGLEVELKERI